MRATVRPGVVPGSRRQRRQPSTELLTLHEASSVSRSFRPYRTRRDGCQRHVVRVRLRAARRPRRLCRPARLLRAVLRLVNEHDERAAIGKAPVMLIARREPRVHASGGVTWCRSGSPYRFERRSDQSWCDCVLDLSARCDARLCSASIARSLCSALACASVTSAIASPVPCTFANAGSDEHASAISPAVMMVDFIALPQCAPRGARHRMIHRSTIRRYA